MRGVILCGGNGTRLQPLTRITNKHLLPMGRYAMIHHQLFLMRDCGITDVMIVMGREHCGDSIRLLGSGAEFGVALTYKVQDTAGGIGEALALAQDFVGKDNVFVLLGDNLFSDKAQITIKWDVNTFDCGGAHIFLKQVDDPERFGCPVFDDNGMITDIVEKPPKNLVPSRFAVVGAYLYDPSIFDILRHVEYSARGEKEITDAHRVFIQSHKITWNTLSGWWLDAGTHATYQRCNELLRGFKHD